MERKRWAVLSGEGEQGTSEIKYATVRGIKGILTNERCGGDRWAHAIEMQPNESKSDAVSRGKLLGWDY